MWGNCALRVSTLVRADFGDHLVSEDALEIGGSSPNYGRVMLALYHHTFRSPLIVDAEELERVVRAARILATNDKIETVKQ